MISADIATYYDRRANWSLVPEHMREGVVLYVMHGVRPGSFMTALLASDLMEALGRADIANANNMLGWAQFLYCHVPAQCRGSYEEVAAWCAHRGLNGLAAGEAA